jgi:hypothetical protein
VVDVGVWLLLGFSDYNIVASLPFFGTLSHLLVFVKVKSPCGELVALHVSIPSLLCCFIALHVFIF